MITVKRYHTGRLACGIFIAALAVRLFFVFHYAAAPVADETDYIRLAGSLMSGNGYVADTGRLTAGRPPGYPLFLAGIFSLFGADNYTAVRLVQAVIDSFLCVFVFLLGCRIFNRRVGAVAGVLAAINLSFIARSSRLLTECAAAFLLLAAVYLLHRAVTKDPENKLRYAAAGILLGISALIRANNALNFVFIFAYIVWFLHARGFGLKRTGYYAGIYVLAFMLPIVPWAVRNYTVFHSFVPLSTLQGIAFYTSYNPAPGKLYGCTPRDRVVEEARRFESEADTSRFLSRQTVSMLRSHPGVFFKLIPLKLAYFFSPLDWELINGRALYNYSFVFWFPFFLASFFLFRRGACGISIAYLQVIAFSAFAVLMFGIPRFRMPAEPYMIIPAAGAIVYFFEKTRNKGAYVSCVLLYLSLNAALTAGSGGAKYALRWLMLRAGLWS
jgi:4-amino-4-deoxy-L-arabinose transferase-like glycosyltransferase